MFTSSIKQPEGYPDVMPLHIALQQPDQSKFIDAMDRELRQHAELKHWKLSTNCKCPNLSIQFPWFGHNDKNVMLLATSSSGRPTGVLEDIVKFLGIPTGPPFHL